MLTARSYFHLIIQWNEQADEWNIACKSFIATHDLLIYCWDREGIK